MTHAKIETYLADGCQDSVAGIARAIGATADAVRTALHAMLDAGRVCVDADTETFYLAQ